MAHRTTLAALLGLLASEATAAAHYSLDETASLRVLDSLLRDIEDDVERLRQALDELLRSEVMTEGTKCWK